MKTTSTLLTVLSFLTVFVSGAEPQPSTTQVEKAHVIAVDANFENGYIGDHKFTAPDTLELSARSSDRAGWFSFRLKGARGKKVNFVIEWKSKGKIFIPNYNINTKAMVTYVGKGYEIIRDQEFVPTEPDKIDGQYFT